MSKYVIEDVTLTAIADAVREKTGGTELILVSELPTAIAGIEGGGGNAPTAEELTFTGSINNLFAYGTWNWFIEKYKDDILFQNITSSQNMFNQNSTIKELGSLTIPFVKANTYNMFGYCQQLTSLPSVSGTWSKYFSGLFMGCHSLPSDEINAFFANLTVDPSDTNNQFHSMFQSCRSVRDLTPALEWVHANINNNDTMNLSTHLQNMFNGCYVLDSLENVPVIYRGSSSTSRTTNAFNSTFADCGRVKDVIFATDNGTPYVVRLGNQTIDLSYYVGYHATETNFTNYGITSDKKVSSSATYAALKDDPDWYAVQQAYSRYNHDSAVRTINSLPDTSAFLSTNSTYTNTIKFKGASGSMTDGGAINTLTEEEIAVATAKGWTVTLV